MVCLYCVADNFFYNSTKHKSWLLVVLQHMWQVAELFNQFCGHRRLQSCPNRLKNSCNMLHYIMSIVAKLTKERRQLCSANKALESPKINVALCSANVPSKRGFQQVLTNAHFFWSFANWSVHIFFQTFVQLRSHVTMCKSQFSSAPLNLHDRHIQMQIKMWEHYRLATYQMAK